MNETSVARERLERTVNSALDAEIVVRDLCEEIRMRLRALRDAKSALARAADDLEAAMHEAEPA